MKVQTSVLSATILAASGVVNASPLINMSGLYKRAVTVNPASQIIDQTIWKCGQQTVRTQAILQAARAAVRALPTPIKSEGNSEYPHEFRNDGNLITFPGCTDDPTAIKYEFPFIGLNSDFEVGKKPGRMRIVVQIPVAGDDGTAEFCGMMMHLPGSQDFALCGNAPRPAPGQPQPTIPPFMPNNPPTVNPPPAVVSAPVATVTPTDAPVAVDPPVVVDPPVAVDPPAPVAVSPPVV